MSKLSTGSGYVSHTATGGNKIVHATEIVIMYFYYAVDLLEYAIGPNILSVPLFQVAEMILNKKELEFYKWNGDLSQLLQGVRDKLNRVAEVILSVLFLLHISTFTVFFINQLFVHCLSSWVVIHTVGFNQSWTREEKNHCLEETEKSFKLSGDILRLILS